MLFYIPPPENNDPADDWKKNGEKPEPGESPPLPGVYLKYGFGQPIDFMLADKLAVRFTEIGFDPDTIKDREMFGMLFLKMGNCLCVVRYNEGPAKDKVRSHYFLEPKKK